MLRTLQGMQRVLKPNGVAAIVIGDVADPGKDPVPLPRKIWDDIGAQTGLRLIELDRGSTCRPITRSAGSGARPRDRPPTVTASSSWRVTMVSHAMVEPRSTGTSRTRTAGPTRRTAGFGLGA